MSNVALAFLQKLFENRVALLLALVTSACAFGWVLYAPDNIRLAAATLYTLLVYIPLVKPVRDAGPPKEPEA